MTALTADRITLKKELGIKAYPVGVAKIYANSLVCLNTSGYAVPGVDTASFTCVGVAEEQVDNSGGSAGDKWVKVKSPVIALYAASSITQAMVGTTMYVIDDQTFDDTSTNGVVAGILVEYVSTTSGWILTGPVTQPLLSGLTASAAELNLIDGSTAGAAVASKAVVLGSASEISGIRRKVNLAAATQTCTAAQSGEKFVGAVDAVFTLPAAAAGTKGVWYEFETGALSVGTGLSISPNAADHIRGNGLTSTDNKDLINTGATDRLGDSVRLYCDGVDGWVIEEIIGTWAKEA